MLKRILTNYKEVPRLSSIMSEQVASVKRAYDETASEKKPKQQKKTSPQAEQKPDRKRKVALLVAYNGKGYYGVQLNPGFPTIESEVCKALLNVGLIPQNHYEAAQKMSFQRAARTDKGVSAVTNVFSLKGNILYKKDFNQKILELFSEVKWKTPNIHYKLLNVDNLIEKLNEQLPPQIRVIDYKRTVKSFNSKTFCDARRYIYLLPTYAFAPLEENVTNSYRTNQEIIDRVNRVLKMYLGTHMFHNFTSRIKCNEGKSRRYIKTIECSEPFVRDGVEFAVISVLGQSFILHQIRKMIGLAIAIVKGYCNEDAIELAWDPEKMDIPKAPGLGLVLEKLYYDVYNKRFGGDGMHVPLDWSDKQDKIDQFKEEQIFSEIVKTEIEENSMINWLSTLHVHSYDTESWWHKRKDLGTAMSPAHDKKESETSTAQEETSSTSENMSSDEKQTLTDTAP